MIKYVTGWLASGLIERVEVDRETETSVFINGRRRSKESRHSTYHDTWIEAKGHLVEQAERDLVQARRKLEKAQGHVGNVNGLKEPID